MSENRVNLLTLSRAFSAFFGAGSGREFPTSFGSGSCETTHAAQSGPGRWFSVLRGLGIAIQLRKKELTATFSTLYERAAHESQNSVVTQYPNNQRSKIGVQE